MIRETLSLSILLVSDVEAAIYISSGVAAAFALHIFKTYWVLDINCGSFGWLNAGTEYSRRFHFVL